MAEQRLRFQLTAFDPNPSDVTLAFNSQTCVVENSSNANISVEEYKTTPEGGPSEIHLKVTPDPIAFVMKFVDGKMTIEFRGSWASFQVNSVQKPATTVVIDDTPAYSDICFKVHLENDDVDSHDIRLAWDGKDLSAPNGGALYKIVSQTDTEKGKEFVIAITHPVTGQVYCLRGILKNDRVTFLNTDKFNLEHVMLYLTFYIKDEALRERIMEEMKNNPGMEIMILYKYGAFAEAIDLSSLIPYIQHKDKDSKPIKSKDDHEDDHVKRAKASKDEADKKGKTGTDKPADDWSCGKVKWELPKEEKKFRDVGKLAMPDLSTAEFGPHLQDVGKLKWGGFDQEEPKEVVKEKPKVGKLKMGAFGGGEAAPSDAPPPKQSWKKRDSVVDLKA